MKLNESQLRRLIKEETRNILRESKSKAHKKPSLRSLLPNIFEDVGDDIEKAYKTGPAAVRSLANSAKDKEELKDALQGSFDKQDEDDVVGKGGGNVSVGSFLPTQKEIDLVKSIGWPLGDLKTLEGMITSKSSTAPGAITVSGDLVIDGHHRWSGIWSVSGKEGTVNVDDLKLPGESTSEKLAAAQLAIAAYKDPGTKQPAADDPIDLNILGKSPDAIEKDILAAEGQKDPKAPGAILNAEYLKGCANSKVVADWAGFKVGDDVEKVKTAIVKKVAGNLASLPDNPEAPARADMPQFDHDDIGGKKAKSDLIGGLEKGEFNVAPPFKPGEKSDKKEDEEKKSAKNDSYTPNGNVMIERWQKLAGIIK